MLGKRGGWAAVCAWKGAVLHLGGRFKSGTRFWLVLLLVWRHRFFFWLDGGACDQALAGFGL